MDLIHTTIASALLQTRRLHPSLGFLDLVHDSLSATITRLRRQLYSLGIGDSSFDFIFRLDAGLRDGSLHMMICTLLQLHKYLNVPELLRKLVVRHDEKKLYSDGDSTINTLCSFCPLLFFSFVSFLSHHGFRVKFTYFRLHFMK